MDLSGYFGFFTTDNKRLIASSTVKNGLYGYILDINELMDLARSRLPRTWTRDEYLKFLHTDVCPPTP